MGDRAEFEILKNLEGTSFQNEFIIAYDGK